MTGAGVRVGAPSPFRSRAPGPTSRSTPSRRRRTPRARSRRFERTAVAPSRSSARPRGCARCRAARGRRGAAAGAHRRVGEQRRAVRAGELRGDLARVFGSAVGGQRARALLAHPGRRSPDASARRRGRGQCARHRRGGDPLAPLLRLLHDEGGDGGADPVLGARARPRDSGERRRAGHGVAAGVRRPAELEALRARIPQQRFGTPEDIAQAVLFLLAGPTFITGQVLAVDGGRSLGSAAGR